ncbi:uncharacterized protein LOC5512531 [Nematostella vectensis]|uniref:uncharacterized protein LOC5512531 n=1 Tax=Nematostella vectensis TaxID=45351 RepID=UPI0020778FE1|nr:uncharacterized protein LOC5512531 [Nematostella vectensis]
MRPNYCKDILECLCHGKWKKKSWVTLQHDEDRVKKDMALREFRGAPVKLSRDDGRCGPENVIKTSPVFGPAIPAGRQIVLVNHVLISAVISAELFNWVPRNEACVLKNYTSEEACRVVSERLDSLVLIGDSLMRHFSNSLFTLFTDDPERGAVQNASEMCHGERQFVDRGPSSCNRKTIRERADVEPRTKFCPGVPYFQYMLNLSYCYEFREGPVELVNKSILAKKRTAFFISVGIHDGFNAKLYQEGYIEPMLSLIGDRDWPKFIWVTTHSPSFTKPVAYRFWQGKEKIRTYNAAMKKYFKAKGVPVFDVFPMTEGVYSYDGTHYGAGLNMMKSQLLINYIEHAFKRKTIPRKNSKSNKS